MTSQLLDHERCYRAHSSRDPRFDGQFVTAVVTTGIYCRPSCPARTPARHNVTFLPTAAAAQALGYRACKRCRPDSAPGSPQWDARGDVVARAMRMLADGEVDRVGVSGVAAALGYSERQLNRLVSAELGCGLLALARARRARVAATLLASTDLPISQVSWAAGFASIRSFNETMAQVYGQAPSALRGAVGRGPGPAGEPVELSFRVAGRAPFDAAGVLGFLGPRSVAGVEHWDGSTYTRTMDLPRAPAVARLRARHDQREQALTVQLKLADLRDLGAAIARIRRVMDADCDPLAVTDVLGGDPLLAAVVAGRPGLRAPGSVDAAEIAVRAIVGQQVSEAGARTLLGRLAARFGRPSEIADPDVSRLFPSPAELAQAGPADLAMPASRARALVEVCAQLADGRLNLGVGADREAVRVQLLAVPGIGPWTADWLVMRGLGDPDVMLPGDLGIRAGMRALGGPETPGAIVAHARAWRPWRSYAVHHLWAVAAQAAGVARCGPAPQTTAERDPAELDPASRTHPTTGVTGTARQEDPDDEVA